MGGLVLACSEKVGSIGGHLEVLDGGIRGMGFEVVEEFATLRCYVSLVKLNGRTLALPSADHEWVEGTFASYCDTVPSSCPAMMYLDR